MSALSFFISSLKLDVNFSRSITNWLKVLLIILVIAVVVWSYQYNRKRELEIKKKKRLFNVLKKQKNILKQKFAIIDESQSNSSIVEPEKNNSALNFASTPEESEKDHFSPIDIEKENIIAKEPIQSNLLQLDTIYKTDKIINPSESIANVIVEGEDISTFPSEWQEFLKENEGKSALRKLNEMLKE